MDLVELQRKLIAAARANAPADGVPYAFEKRIMARLPDRVSPDPRQIWERGLARAAGYCALAALVLTIGSYCLPSPAPEPLSQDVEKTLFAAVDNTGTDMPAENQ